MKHTLLLVGFALGLAQSALAWGLGDLANAAESLSGRSMCKVCEKQIRKGDIGFDEGFCPSHKDYKPCAGGCGNLTYPYPPFGGPYCSQCQSKRDEKDRAERETREAKERAEREAREAKEQAERAKERAEREAREAKERAERDEKHLREMYRSSVDAELVANCNEQLASCDLNSMKICADETQDECRNTVKEYGNRILSQLDTLKPDSEKKTRLGKGVGILDLLSVAESNGVYQLSVVSEEDFLASWKSAGAIPKVVYFDRQIIRSISDYVKHAKALTAAIAKAKVEKARILTEAKAIVDDPTQKYGLSGGEKVHPQLYKEFRAGMTRKWISAWATINDKSFDYDTFKFGDQSVKLVFRNDILIGATIYLSSAVSYDALLQKYRDRVGAGAKVDTRQEEPEFDPNRTTGSIVAFVQKTQKTVTGADLCVSFSYEDDVGFVQLLPTTVTDLDNLKLWNEAEYSRKARSYLVWEGNPGDLIISLDGKVTFNSRDAKKLTKTEKDGLIITWAGGIDQLKHKGGAVRALTITGIAAEAACEKLERDQKDKAAKEAAEKAKQKESAALDF